MGAIRPDDQSLRFHVVKHGSRWTVEDLMNPYSQLKVFASTALAQAHCDRRNAGKQR